MPTGGSSRDRSGSRSIGGRGRPSGTGTARTHAGRASWQSSCRRDPRDQRPVRAGPSARAAPAPFIEHPAMRTHEPAVPSPTDAVGPSTIDGPPPQVSTPATVDPGADGSGLVPATLLVSSRRGFLRGALVVAGGAVAATVAACAPAAGSAWSY